jgi:hypothetical protein
MTSGLPPISSSWIQAPWAPWEVFFFQLNTCGYNPYVTSSLTRGWVCRLQLLLALASAVILRSESRGTHDHIFLSQIRDFPNLEDQVHVFISPRNRLAQLYPPFHRLLRLAGLRTCLHSGYWLCPLTCSAYNISARIAQKTLHLLLWYCCFVSVAVPTWSLLSHCLVTSE